MFLKIEGQTRVPANSLPYSLLCPLNKPQKIIYHTCTWSQQTQQHILLCRLFHSYHAGVKRSWPSTSQRSRQTSHGIQLNNGYLITKCCFCCVCLCECVRICGCTAYGHFWITAKVCVGVSVLLQVTGKRSNTNLFKEAALTET